MSLLTPVEEGRHTRSGGARPLTIRISSGVGEGRTRLSAFDAALLDAGVANFNLIRLSSVIPPGSQVTTVGAHHQLLGRHGDRLYCVYAEAYASTTLDEAWAGMAWSQRADESGEGLFVEHAGASEASVKHDLRLSLADLSNRRGRGFVEAGMLTASAACVSHPVCAVVIATFQTAPWARHDG